MELSDRKRKILRTIVESYIETAEPVGSKTIADLAGLKLSSATIRNEMADLTAMGYLEQPHTSAGRIPSPAGYRLYVNELMDDHKLTLEETRSLNEALRLKMQELDQVIGEASRVVSQLTNYPAFISSAASTRATVRRYEVLHVDRGSYLAVVLTNLNQAQNKLLSYPADFSEEQMQLLCSILNGKFTGRNVDQFSPELLRSVRDEAGDTLELLVLTVSFAVEVLRHQENQNIRVAGATHLLQQPEYRNVDKAQKLLTYLADDSKLAALTAPSAADGMQIIIGPENVADELKDTSVVVASYDIGDNMRGLIGVVGPTRMDYAKVAARLSYFADGMSRLFGGDALPPPREDPEEK